MIIVTVGRKRKRGERRPGRFDGMSKREIYLKLLQSYQRALRKELREGERQSRRSRNDLTGLNLYP